MKELDYKLHTSCESCEAVRGVKVMLALPEGRDITAGLSSEIGHFVSELYRKIDIDLNNTDPAVQARNAEQVKAMTELFDEPIFVEQIPNGYGPWGAPWLIVTTKIGRIKIGWRKRVIEIDYSDSTVNAAANYIFPDENVTKGDRYIHAWGYDKAREYIKKIMSLREPV